MVRDLKGKTAHFGRLFAILVEKNSELPLGHKDRKFKGRVVFDGSSVKDQNKDIALFQELSSSPATMQASKAADTYGLFEGHDIQQADAKQAYTQSKLGHRPGFSCLETSGLSLGSTCAIPSAL